MTIGLFPFTCRVNIVSHVDNHVVHSVLSTKTCGVIKMDTDVSSYLNAQGTFSYGEDYAKCFASIDEAQDEIDNLLRKGVHFRDNTYTVHLDSAGKYVIHHGRMFVTKLAGELYLAKKRAQATEFTSRQAAFEALGQL